MTGVRARTTCSGGAEASGSTPTTWRAMAMPTNRFATIVARSSGWSAVTRDVAADVAADAADGSGAQFEVTVEVTRWAGALGVGGCRRGHDRGQYESDG